MKAYFTGTNGFEVDVVLSKWISDPSLFQELTVYEKSLYMFVKPNKRVKILGWELMEFPHCCGFQIGYNLSNPSWSLDVLEQWWKWQLPFMMVPVIGIIPKMLDEAGSLLPYGIEEYDWFASKGVQIADPIKNVRYPNHALLPYVWFQNDYMDKLFHPKYEHTFLP